MPRRAETPAGTHIPEHDAPGDWHARHLNAAQILEEWDNLKATARHPRADPVGRELKRRAIEQISFWSLRVAFAATQQPELRQMFWTTYAELCHIACVKPDETLRPINLAP